MKRSIWLAGSRSYAEWMLDSHHRAHIGTAGRVADHSGTAADQRDRLVACICMRFIRPEHKVANVQAVWVKAI